MEPIVYYFPKNTDLLRTIRFKPLKKIDPNGEYNIKLKIYACISNILFY